MATLNYNQLLEQIRQLPEDEFRQLLATLSSELKLAKDSPKKNLQQLLLKAPTWSDQQLDAYQQAHDFINQSRLA